MKEKRNYKAPLIIVLTLIAFIITAVYAAYYKETVELKNTFEPASSVTPVITEKFEENDNKLKEDVKFNVGVTDYPVYVRVKVVISWQDESGNVYYKPPIENTDSVAGDYDIDINSDDWELKEDGYYYYKEVVESNGNTSNLINSCKQIKAAPADGYTLSVELIVQTVQAIGSTDGENDTDEMPAWKDADWKGTDAWVVS